MSANQNQEQPNRFKQVLWKWWLDGPLLAIVVSMIAWIFWIALGSWEDKQSWLIVPITTIYSILTLWMAGAAVQNAQAARRSAEAMEESVREQRLARWAAYGASLTFPEGEVYTRKSDGTIEIVLGNLFQQPVIQLTIVLWFMDQAPGHEGQICYSTMMESRQLDLNSETSVIAVDLYETERPESYRVQLGNAAMTRYQDVFGEVPKSTLCLIQYRDRADLSFRIFVYDLKENTKKIVIGA